MTDAKWPYSTNDEVSHLACEDVAVLRARIDQLIEERRELRRVNGYGEVTVPAEWRLTPGEHRLFSALALGGDRVVTKERLHAAFSGEDPETELKVVDVVVCKMRKKLAPFGASIETVWGRGYQLDPYTRLQFARR